MSRLALLSVSDKTGIVELAQELVAKHQFEIISSGGTAKTLQNAGITVTKVSDYTGSPEILGGRVKTLHPRIHGGILARQDLAEDIAELEANNIRPFSLVVVNLYPFEQTIAQPNVTVAEAIEKIDIGGPTLIRAAAKNFKYLTVLSNPSQYDDYLAAYEQSGGEISLEFRQKMAGAAFAHTNNYDRAIAAYFANLNQTEDFGDSYGISGSKVQSLRYGENPHQPAAWYQTGAIPSGWASATKLQGKELSYNNLVDLEAARRIITEFDPSEPAAAVLKHTNPCGAAVGTSLVDAYQKAFNADNVSAFGGIVALNQPIDAATAEALTQTFLECVVAPGCDEAAQAILQGKSKLRILILPDLTTGQPETIKPWSVYAQINANYQLSPSYPAVLAGPSSIDETNQDSFRILQQSAAFRSEQRLPALTWASGVDGASLWRCSQPKIGLQGNRSAADELLIKHIQEQAASANAMSNYAYRINLPASIVAQFTGVSPYNAADVASWMSPNCELKILDLRPRASAMANRTGGYGYENTSNYPGTTLQFCNIGNIHAVRDAYQKMCALCVSPSTQDLQWPSLVEDTKWLSSIRFILAASWETAFWIHVHRLPVLLHCSHGWDRTSQVAVLAQLLLDPYYRTCKGFACLVEKDFMAFGHPFHTRCAHGEGRSQDASSGAPPTTSHDEGQVSPIFVQFLDAVFQVVNQYPEAFEFNTKYLRFISDHLYSCRFGNFLCDTERERERVAGLRQRTHSLWDHLDETAEQGGLLNKTFDAADNQGALLMPLPLLLRNVTLWVDRHARYGPGVTRSSVIQ